MNDPARLASAYRVCESITKRAGANFSVGFRFLPADKRKAVYAAYAFCRLADDLADENDPGDAPALLAKWEAELDATYSGRPGHPVSLALADSLLRHPIPKEAFAGLIDGCRDDLVLKRYRTFDHLMGYVRKVAWTISDISLAIFGPLPGRSEEAFDLGRDLATALQLTNICRDVADDVPRGRIYLPLEELERFGVTEEELLGLAGGERFLALMDFECRRARGYFERARELPTLLEEDARLAVALMGGVYSTVLAKVAADPSAVLRGRVHLSIGEKLALVASRARRRLVF